MIFFFLILTLSCFSLITANSIYFEAFRRMKMKTNNINYAEMPIKFKKVNKGDKNPQKNSYSMKLAQSYFHDNVREIMNSIQKERENSIFREHLVARKMNSFMRDFHTMRYY
jgi:hypothetical protein